jgi:hypothetical protein
MKNLIAIIAIVVFTAISAFSSDPVWVTVGTGKSSDIQTLTIAVDLVALTVNASTSAVQATIPHLQPAGAAASDQTVGFDLAGAYGYGVVYQVTQDAWAPVPTNGSITNDNCNVVDGTTSLGATTGTQTVTVIVKKIKALAGTTHGDYSSVIHCSAAYATGY